MNVWIRLDVHANGIYFPLVRAQPKVEVRQREAGNWKLIHIRADTSQFLSYART